jgi:hypothetical protein
MGKKSILKSISNKTNCNQKNGDKIWRRKKKEWNLIGISIL